MGLFAASSLGVWLPTAVAGVPIMTIRFGFAALSAVCIAFACVEAWRFSRVLPAAAAVEHEACPNCLHDLRHDQVQGACPRCGHSYHRPSAKRAWLEAERRHQSVGQHGI